MFKFPLHRCQLYFYDMYVYFSLKWHGLLNLKIAFPFSLILILEKI